MRLLLDTHAVLWFLLGSERLSAAARDAFRSPDNEPLASAVTGYEIANKARLGKPDFPVVHELQVIW